MPYSSPPALEFRSVDKRFALSIVNGHVRELLRHCEKAGVRETGGTLIGHYTDGLDCAVVTRVCGPEEDSRAGATWFERGTKTLRALLDEYWRRGRGYYLGEWHFHPGAAPTPSGPDRRAMRRIALDPGSQCRQPVLLIVGGDSTCWSASAHVFPARADPVELLQLPTGLYPGLAPASLSQEP